MRKNIQRKLNSQDGASLVIALLLFLVATIVGSVILTGATAAAGRVSQRRELKKERYALDSAAELIKNSLTNPTDGKLNAKFEATYIYDDENGTVNGTMTGKEATFTINGATPTDAIGQMIQTTAQQVITKLWKTEANNGKKSTEVDGLKDSWPQVENDSDKKTEGEKTVSDYTLNSMTKAWICKNVDQSFVTGKLKITLSGEGTDDFPTVDVEITANQNGNMVITLKPSKREDSESGTEVHTQQLVLTLQSKPIRLEYSAELSGEGETQEMIKTVAYVQEWDKLIIKQSYTNS